MTDATSEPDRLSAETIATIVAAFAQRPDAGVEDIVRLTERLSGLSAAAARPALAPKPAAPRPACDPAAAISPDAVRCLCCGKSFKTLKRHLQSAHGLSEAGYRAMFGLSEDYPIVAPSYSERRSQVASETGFGTYDRGAPGASADVA